MANNTRFDEMVRQLNRYPVDQIELTDQLMKEIQRRTTRTVRIRLKRKTVVLLGTMLSLFFSVTAAAAIWFPEQWNGVSLHTHHSAGTEPTAINSLSGKERLMTWLEQPGVVKKQSTTPSFTIPSLDIGMTLIKQINGEIVLDISANGLVHSSGLASRSFTQSNIHIYEHEDQWLTIIQTKDEEMSQTVTNNAKMEMHYNGGWEVLTSNSNILATYHSNGDDQLINVSIKNADGEVISAQLNSSHLDRETIVAIMNQYIEKYQ